VPSESTVGPHVTDLILSRNGFPIVDLEQDSLPIRLKEKGLLCKDKYPFKFIILILKLRFIYS